jgi:hypothetical protein
MTDGVPNWSLPDGTITKLGNHVPHVRTVRVMLKLPDIPDSELREFDLTTNPDWPVKVKNQGSFGACNGHAAATSLEIARYIAGMTHVPLSSWLIYADLCQGWDRGSIIADALKHLSNVGTCPEPLVPHGTIQPRRVSQEARAEVLRFRVEIGYEVNTHRDLVIATHLRIPTNFSVPVNGSFNQLDADGVPGNRPGPHNHAVCGGVGLKRSTKHGWLVMTQNSWGEQWGQRGFFWAAERTTQGSYPDAYGVWAVTSDPQDPFPVVA